MKNKIFFGSTIFLIIISLTANYVLWNRNELLKRGIKVPPFQQQSVGKETLVTFGKNEIVISSVSAVINESFESHNPLSIVIDAKNYPDLFLPENEFARLHVEEVSAGKLQNIKLIRIARQIPDHGSLADSYYILFDPAIGKVVDTGWSHFFGTVYLYSSCMNCALPLLEFTDYDQKQAKFVLTNNEHKKEFQDLVQQHLKIQKTETCRINGKDMTIAEALRGANDTDKCADQLLGITNNKTSDGFITIGQYKSILNNIQKVISGENIKIFEHT